MGIEDLDVSDLELALSSAKIGVWKWLIAEDKIIWSPEVFDIFGIAPESLDGELRFDHYQSLIHEDDLSMVNDAITRAREDRGNYRIEHRLCIGDTIRWARGQGRFLFGDTDQPYCLTGTVEDITEERQGHTDFAKMSKRIQLYSELASDYIYSADLTKPTITPSIIAGSFERTTGYSPDEIEQIGGWVSLIHPDDLARVGPVMEELGKGHPIVNEYRILSKDSGYRWLRDRVHPVLAENGELIGMNGGVQDITERRLLLEQLGHAQKMEALAHLAGNVAHDFNNLLTVMYAASGLIKTEVKGRVALEALNALDTATTRATDLTTSLLTFSRRQVAIRHPKRLREVLDGAMPILTRAIGERVSIHLEDTSDQVFVVVDCSQIELALLNLVVNAKDAMPNGGVVTIGASEETWQADDDKKPAELPHGRYAQITVSDSGTGISNETMAHMFEPFYTTKDAGSGTGLGLAAVHGVVLQHDGAIQVSSETGVGSTFTIYLPTTTAITKDTVPKVTSSLTIGGTEHILVVEDDPLVRSVTVRNLVELGYKVVSAGSAEDAMPLVQDVDIILSDVRLPNMPGTELALDVAERWPDKPIVLMSGLVEDGAQKAVIESGVFRFLPKPFTQSALANALRAALED